MWILDASDANVVSSSFTLRMMIKMSNNLLHISANKRCLPQLFYP